jgi:hypothetical protein
MLKILGKRSSINVRKVWTCDEVGLTYQQEDYGSGFQPVDTAEFRALNPNGLVPVLLDDFCAVGVKQHLPLFDAQTGREDCYRLRLRAQRMSSAGWTGRPRSLTMPGAMPLWGWCVKTRVFRIRRR